MSGFNYNICLAGLDSVVFHYDNSNERTDCNISCILMSTLDCDSSHPLQALPKRPALGPCDTNNSSQPHASRREARSRPYPKKRPESLQLTRLKNRTPHVTSSVSSPAPAPVPAPVPQQPPYSLPPLLSVPSLVLPSFSDLETSPIPSPISPSHAPYHDIPSLYHHNSPYVPWPSPLRRQFIRPPSATSSKYPQSYTRAGAVAPEPMCYEERDRRTVGERIKTIRRSLQHGIKSAALHLCIKKRTKAFPNKTKSVNMPLPAAPRRLSVLSCDTVMTNSLEVWLADRRRRSIDRDPKQTRQTLEEYERSGSWIQYEALPARVVSSPVSIADSYLSGLSLRTTESDVDVFFPPTPSVTGLQHWQSASAASSAMSISDVQERMAESTARPYQRVRSPLTTTFA
jgi:hypothetical protein